MKLKIGRPCAVTSSHCVETWGKIHEALVAQSPLEQVVLNKVAHGHGVGNHKVLATLTPEHRGRRFVKYAIKSGWLVEA